MVRPWNPYRTFTRFPATTPTGHFGLLGDTVLDLAFLVLGLALFGVTAAYAAACDRM